jgi:3-isopropylmalate/(R)-2-methylmalate dehydratase small subunit
VRARGRAWTFGDNIPTDRIVKGHLVLEPMEVIARHVLEDLRPEFPKEAKPGDILVAGSHFGQSSGRAIAAKALKALGLGCVVADSMARTFYRNCYEIGLPGAECPGVTRWIQDGDEVEVDLAAGRITRLTHGSERQLEPVHPLLLRMLERGGLIPMGAELAEWRSATRE